MIGQDTTRQDSEEIPPGWEELLLVDAAERLDLTTEALRKRIQRGSIPGHKRDGQWYAVLPIQTGEADGSEEAPPMAGQEPESASQLGEPDQPDLAATGHHAGHPADTTSQEVSNGQPSPGELATLREEVAFLRQELSARRREVQQLHTLLAQAQQLALPAPVDRSEPTPERPDTRPDTEGDRPDAATNTREWDWERDRVGGFEDQAPTAAVASASRRRRPWWKFW